MSLSIQEVSALLMRVQIIDRRPVDEAVLLEWEQALAGVDDFAAAMEAVTMHRQESGAWLLPVHVIENVRRIHRAVASPEDEYGNPVPEDRNALEAAQRAAQGRTARGLGTGQQAGRDASADWSVESERGRCGEWSLDGHGAHLRCVLRVAHRGTHAYQRATDSGVTS